MSGKPIFQNWNFIQTRNVYTPRRYSKSPSDTESPTDGKPINEPNQYQYTRQYFKKKEVHQ